MAAHPQATGQCWIRDQVRLAPLLQNPDKLSSLSHHLGKGRRETVPVNGGDCSLDIVVDSVMTHLYQAIHDFKDSVSGPGVAVILPPDTTGVDQPDPIHFPREGLMGMPAHDDIGLGEFCQLSQSLRRSVRIKMFVNGGRTPVGQEDPCTLDIQANLVGKRG